MANKVIFQFKDKAENQTDTLIRKWIGKTDRACSNSTVYLQIYNQDTGSWENLDSNNSAATGVEFTLEGSKSSNLSNYCDGSNWVSCRVYQESK